MEDRKSLANRHRPKTLPDLIGQKWLQQTLTNAILSGRTAHGYVFSGPRGTGKTSTARILARALNCEKGPTPVPCGACPQCEAILKDRHPDVIEMDAASRTGVEDVRQILDGVPYAPIMGQKKVIIIDEAHMLSEKAWNAFLKTLEEPPANLIFIFCTTDPRKILVTILSRCQHFRLKLVPTGELALHYARIDAEEGCKTSEGAIAFVAKAAEGSVRDGLSILDQLQATFPGGASEDDARAMLGLADAKRIAEIVELALRKKAGEALAVWRTLLAEGADPLQAVKDALERVHAVNVAAAGVIDADDPEEGKSLGILVAEIPADRLKEAWASLARSFQEVQQAPNRAQAGDMAILRLAA